MAVRVFKSYQSTVTPFVPHDVPGPQRLMSDPVTGAPVGIQTMSANGPDGIWTPVDITAAQASSPTAAMLADLNATYRLNVPPYTRYYSSGVSLANF